MTDTTELPDWLTIGAPVAVVEPGRRVALDTVKSIGKRDIVLTNGDRFNRNRFRDGGFCVHTERGFRASASWLLPRDHPMVRDTRAELHGFSLRARVGAAADAWERKRDDVERLDKLIAAATELAEWMRVDGDPA
ncbi:hypothetical protein DEU38_103162 [Rhodococcus sp. AG1013]|uniref:hypothetical protein n=1 Tax=Rhodococcus sp. AG1013 TaxID=2183996 RepID=UPI000E0A9A1F|nr:hypothetical protein [Rhodococcus sp. AG1013]RDI32429.1 hypothetical protein DEU38_103162 [Rhodococcus sp. AG1013]